MDINEAAPALALENARAQGLEARASFWAGDLRQLPELLADDARASHGPFDLVVATPPYHHRSTRLASYAGDALRFASGASQVTSMYGAVAEAVQAPG
ncbi:unnamed protein product, partial [Prorocentrum cordatum]